MIDRDLALRVQRLLSERTPFVLATVVRAHRPTSVRPGDAAIVLADGSIEGFVGGVCAVSSVRLHGLRAMETGEPLVLRLLPDEGEADPADAMEGAVVERNPCLSGGAMEIFLEPHLPPARLVVIGGSPIADALSRVAGAAGYDCERAATGDGIQIGGAGAVIVASHGNDEEAILAEALRAGIPYVALVASRRRGEAVRGGLPVPTELAAQLHTPAGLDIGARSPGEIAVAILADIIARGHTDPVPGRPARPGTPSPAAEGSARAEATDPVCGMRVALTPATPQLVAGGQTVYFCSGHCRDAYAAQHAVP